MKEMAIMLSKYQENATSAFNLSNYVDGLVPDSNKVCHISTDFKSKIFLIENSFILIWKMYSVYFSPSICLHIYHIS